MGQSGFSLAGAGFLVLLLIPNLLWTRHRPRDYDPSAESRVLPAPERAGQAWVTCAVPVFQDCNLRPWTVWSWWLAGAALLMALYEYRWLRCFRSERTMVDFTAGLPGIPVAGATLPVAAFFLPGIYGRNLRMLPGGTVLGAGHIGVHLQHRSAAGKE